jgi:alanyl-tRNA synthetase
MLSSHEIWKLWHSFRKSKNHIHLTPASLIADKNSTALFTVAGMQPLIPYLSGQEHPLGTRLHDIQHCIRTNDLEEVGDNSHHTMFFMMGNWSLGDYFKKDAI